MKGRPVAIVTGASRGIGAATALRLAQIGCDLALVARSAADLERTAAQARTNGASVLTHTADLTEDGAGIAAVDAALDRFGHLHALVNNAATLEPIAPVHAVDLAALRRSLKLGLMAPIELMQRAIPALRSS